MKALILSGGGAKGSFEAGVVQQLFGAGYVPDAGYGTSAGGLNIADLAFNGPAGLMKTWQSIKGNSDVYVSKDTLGIPINLVGDLIGGSGLGIFNTNPLKGLIAKAIVGKPAFPATVCRVSLDTEEKQYVTANPDGTFKATSTEDLAPGAVTLPEFQKAVLSTASIPGVFDLVDDEWGDGGLRAQTPIQQAINDGHTDLTIVLCNPYQENVFLGRKVGNVVDVLVKMVETMLQELFWKDIQEALDVAGLKLTVYAPSAPLGDPMEFDEKTILSQIAMGASAKPVFIK